MANTAPQNLNNIDPDDRTLIIRIAAQDRAAFGKLTNRYNSLLFSIAWRMTGDQGAAEDILQESFFRVWQHAGLWDGSKASVKTWLCRITSNLCIDRYRKKKRETLVPDLPVIADERQDTSRNLQDQQLSQIVEQALQTLPERQRAALILFYYEQLNVFETAAALETTVKGAENLLYRARQTLKQELVAYKELLQ